MPLELHVVTPTQDALNVSCDEAIIPGASGELGFLPGHVPLITALKPGVLVTIAEGRKSYYVVSSGFAEIDADRVTIVTDSFEPASSIDAERARRALLETEDKLKNLGPEDPGYFEVVRRAARAQARIDAVARSHPQ